MIEIIIGKVEMPKLHERRFQRQNDDSGKEWWVVDTDQHFRIVYRGKYIDASIACYNLNKKHYKSLLLMGL